VIVRIRVKEIIIRVEIPTFLFGKVGILHYYDGLGLLMKHAFVQGAGVFCLNDEFHLQAEHIHAGSNKITQYIQSKCGHQSAFRNAKLRKQNGIASQGTAGDGGRGNGQNYSGKDDQNEPCGGAFYGVNICGVNTNQNKA